MSIDFTINLSMIGRNITGLGVYSLRCTEYLDDAFNCSIISNYYKSDQGNEIIAPIGEIELGNVNKITYLKRMFYLNIIFPRRDSFIYTPTHHGVFGVKRQIITIHDLIPIHHPQQHKLQYLYFKYYLPSLVKQCKAIFTVSQTAKEDICKYYKVDMRKVLVVPNGVDTKMFTPQKEMKCIAPYLLVVGAAYPHKNIHELLNNWQVWKGKYKLKIASARGKYGEYLKKIVAQYKLEQDVEFLGYVTQEQLIKLYQDCKALVFPSLWEGFGLPPIEALACDRPVIVSDIPVHKEILQDAAIYITLGKRDTWEEAFAMLDDNQQIESKLKLAPKIIKQYNWDRTGEILINSLLQVEPSLIDSLKNK
jgi:glycosyltransferase involved in cell wall biosynthesis